MDTNHIEIIRTSLRSLIATTAASLEDFEQTCSKVSRELELDPLKNFRRRATPRELSDPQHPVVDGSRLSIIFRGKICFLGDTLSFHLFARLAQRPNCYVKYEDLLTDVWDAQRSDAAIRSVAKTLRQKLRHAEMPELAAAVDGSARRHYALNLSR